ncbi:MAG TPA: alcohol dehydrogenase catalytic domain-containing protein [Candidatus Dormibacteraeota bacterium]|nr:alcohol dehydrogenase catalytic domain-containing protein [Candidatus Dormibacteraeota bacterium]
MRAAVVDDSSRGLRVATLPDPAPGPGELVLRVRAAGVCGTDLHLLGDPPAVPPGTVLGHEFAGEVAALGPGVDGWRVGDRVCALPYMACGACTACRDGDSMGCTALRPIGSGDLPGAFAEYVRVGARETLRLPAGLGYDAGALVEPLAVGLHAVRTAAPRPGEHVVVLGAGAIGLAAASWARAAGAAEVVVVDGLASRRALAATFGATVVLDAADEDALFALPDRLGGPPALVIECVGAPGLLQQTIGLVRRRGRIVVAGACMAPDAIVPAMACLKEVGLHFVVGYRRDEFADALAALAGGGVAGPAMITDRVDLDALPAAFSALRRPIAQGKVLVCP